MPTQMETDATTILRYVVSKQERIRPQFELLGDEPPCEATGPEIQEGTGLPPGRINDAVALLEMNDYAKVMRWMGTVPFDFGEVQITPLGRYELQRLGAPEEEEHEEEPDRAVAPSGSVTRSPIPRGSPYGFEAHDWEFVETELSRTGHLKIVFGHPWQSEHFEADALKRNLEEQFANALAVYTQEPGGESAELNFVPLKGGYGEHLFNEIARDIISADIAVFDTSDLNSNVMIELGVALTWDVRVLPIRADGTPEPPSDISGQTWACYRDSGAQWVDADHKTKVLAMVRRAMRKKGSRN